MRCLVIGTGSIGLRHCRNLIALGHEVVAWDSDERRRREAARLGIEVPDTLAEAFCTGPTAALICTPPAHHVAPALEALGAGAHVFIEKPIAHASDRVPSLIEEAERRARLIAVGFNLRFLPSLRRVRRLIEDHRAGRPLAVRAEFGSYLPDWRPGRDYRDGYAVSAALGGGILLDAIHELDYLGWLFGEAVEVLATAEHVSALAGDTEDVAEVTVRFASGLVAQVHLDYLQRAYRRNLQVIGETGVITWDYPTHAVTVHDAAGQPQIEDVRAGDGDANAMFVEELRHFIRCAEGREAPLVDGREALRSLRLVEAARASSRERRWVKIEAR
jgi:predicted dehydrogenase